MGGLRGAGFATTLGFCGFAGVERAAGLAGALVVVVTTAGLVAALGVFIV